MTSLYLLENKDSQEHIYIGTRCPAYLVSLGLPRDTGYRGYIISKYCCLPILSSITTMPMCFCTLGGCQDLGGVQLDPRAYKRHQRADAVVLARSARTTSESAIAARDEDISVYIAAMTLSDNVSGPTQRGGRLWSKSSPDPKDVENLNKHIPPSSCTTSTTDPIPFPLPREASRSSRPNTSRNDFIKESLRSLAESEQKLLGIEAKISDAMREAGTLPVSLKPLFSECSEIESQLGRIQKRDASVIETKRRVSERLVRVQAALVHAKQKWKTQATQEMPQTPPNTNSTLTYTTGMSTLSIQNRLTNLLLDHHFSPLLELTDPVIQVTLFLMVALHIVLGISRRGCHFLLEAVQYIVQLVLMRSSSTLSQRDRKLMSDFPLDPATATAHFGLDGKHEIYAVCPNPQCHKTYKPKYMGNSPIPIYPSFCTNQGIQADQSCDEQLTRPQVIHGVEVHIPIKVFVYHDFKDWVAGLMSRPGFEAKMDSSWNQLERDSEGIPLEMRDIFHGEFLREFKGLDGKHFSAGGDEGRYVFSLCVDFFNPGTNKQAGKKQSIGLISLVCLNLPPSIRYKSQNMFLAGVIPGPHEPPLSSLNHYLTPLVDDLVEFWEGGIHFSRTAGFPAGRLVRCALIAVVCDLPAARKVGAFASSAHEHFCSVCHCTRSKNGYGDCDFSSWRRRTDSECRTAAEQYLNSEDNTTKQRIFDAFGMRWSELLRLSYFDVARCVVIDAMHNLFLGLLKEHFDGILGIRLAKEEKETVIKLVLPQEWENFGKREQQSIAKIKKMLEAPLSKQIQEDRQKVFKQFYTCHVRALAFFCHELGCPPVDHPHARAMAKLTKTEYVNRLLAWVSTLIAHASLC